MSESQHGPITAALLDRVRVAEAGHAHWQQEARRLAESEDIANRAADDIAAWVACLISIEARRGNDVVAGLSLAVARRLERPVAEVRAAVERFIGTHDRLKAENAALRAQVAAMAGEAARSRRQSGAWEREAREQREGGTR